MTTRQEAAELRSSAEGRGPQYRSAADRPGQRRSSPELGGGQLCTPARTANITLRAAGADGSGPLVFDGFASVTGQSYEMYDWAGPYEETVHVGAFTETLGREGLDVPLVLEHNSMKRIARTGNTASPLLLTEVTEGDTTGLHTLAPMLDPDNPYVREIAPLLRSGLIDEMSFRFMITAGRWSDDWLEFHIHAVDIHRGDVSIVGYGANPHTEGAGLREKSAPELRGVPVGLVRAGLDDALR